MAIFNTYYQSPLGLLKLNSDEQCLLQVEFVDQTLPEKSSSVPTPLKIAINWLDAYFSGRKPSTSILPLRPCGTPFQIEVWELLQEIPYGQATTYGRIAAIIAKKHGQVRMSAQAVGQAVGANPIPIMIPCHRVLGTNGKLTGYAGGLHRKILLLDHEQITYKK